LTPILCLFLLAALASLPGSSAHSQGAFQTSPWLPPLNLSENAGRSTFPLVAAVEPSGDLVAVWTDYSDDPLGEVMARTRPASTGVWADPLDLSASPEADEGATLYAAAPGSAHAAWTRRDTQAGSDIVYRRWAAGGWSAPEILDHTATYLPSSYSLFFVEDVSGTLCLFVTLGSGIRHTCLRGGTWEPLSAWVYLPDVRRVGAIVAGPDGRFHVAVFGPNQDAPSGCDPWLDDAYYTTTDGTSWEPLLNLTYTGTIAYDVGLAFDGDGALHFLWSDISPFCSLDSERSAVYERVLAGGTWGERRDVSTPRVDQAVEDLDLLAGPSGLLYLAWSEGTFNASGQAIDLTVRYRRWAAGNWEGEELVWDSAPDSLNVSLALYRRIVPVVVWEEGSPTAEEVFFSQRGTLFQLDIPLLMRGEQAR
jgi:hypothetical protein